MARKIKNHIVVIVIEDELLIRMAIVEALLEDGFEVLEATHAREAITMLEANAAQVHALFTDVNMPGDLDGMGLTRHAHIHWPWLSLLVTSGRSYPTAGALPEGTKFISKPYQPTNVILNIREMCTAA